MNKIDRDELIALTRRLIRAQSLSGQEREAAQILKDTMIALGYDEVWIDPYGSVVGKVKGSGGGPSVLFDGHIDTVPVADPGKWTRDPFGGEIADGRMYGRGTSDMKAAVAAAVLAVGAIAREAARTGVRPKGDLYVSGTVFEEVFEGAALGKVLETVRPDLVVIMEATGLKLNIGQRGRAEVTIAAHGRSAHSSNPDFGANAVYAMMPVISAIRAMQPAEHAVLGRGISVVTDIISSPYPGASVVPDRCAITIDRRLLIGEDPASVIAEYESLLPADGRYEVGIARAERQCYTGAVLGGERFFPAWLMPEDDPWVGLALEALRGIGQEPELGVYRFCTNGSFSAGTAGIPTIGYGPSYEHLAHIVDEYIELDQLERAAEGYLAIARRIAG